LRLRLLADIGAERQKARALLDLVGGDRVIVDDHHDALLPAQRRRLGAVRLVGGGGPFVGLGRLRRQVGGMPSPYADAECQDGGPRADTMAVRSHVGLPPSQSGYGLAERAIPLDSECASLAAVGACLISLSTGLACQQAYNNNGAAMAAAS